MRSSFAAVVLALAVVLPASAYDIQGWDWTWQDDPVEDGFNLNLGSFPGGVGTPEEIEDAYVLATWIWGVDGAALLHLPYNGTTTDTTYGGGDNDVNVTMYKSSTYGSTLAKSVYNSIDGNMVDCDIQFYGANSNGTLTWSFDYDGAPANEFDFTHTAVHELGHCIGLGHSDFEAAIMYPYSSTGTSWEKRNLHSDDIAGVQAIYGVATVALVIQDGVVEDILGGDGDGVAEPGETLAFEVYVTNGGTGRAYDVIGELEAVSPLIDIQVAEAGMGTIPPGSDLGSEAPFLLFEVGVSGTCDHDQTVTLSLLVTDAASNAAEESWNLDLICGAGGDNDDGDDDDGDDDGGSSIVGGEGCSCDQSAARAAWWPALLLGLAAAARRRSRYVAR